MVKGKKKKKPRINFQDWNYWASCHDSLSLESCHHVYAAIGIKVTRHSLSGSGTELLKSSV